MWKICGVSKVVPALFDSVHDDYVSGAIAHSNIMSYVPVIIGML